MENTHEKSPWLVVLLVLLASGVGLTFGSGIGGLVAMEMYDGEGSFLDAVTNPTDAARIPMLTMQAISALVGLILVPGLVWWRLRHKPVSAFFTERAGWQILALTVFLVIAFAIVDSAIIQWNKNWKLPSFLSEFESWAQAKELQLERLTKVLVSFASPQEFFIGLLVIAVLAGLTEEFFFRGLIQTELLRAFRQPHVAIWLTAFFFSAIHMQFYGFVPRMLLGALFGYLYVWSGNLWLPIVAHITNNGFSLIVVYLHQQSPLPLDVENEAAPWPIVIVFLVLTVFLIRKIYFTFHPQQA
jgi:membrane protease YdiL (CAAX protease family)